MVGARTVQLCTAVMWRGFSIVQDLIKGLVEFMERKGYKSIEDFEGISLKYIVEDPKFLVAEARAVVNESRCIGCGICVTACEDAMYGAITIKNNVAVINEAKCRGCGLCRIVCPILDCIRLTKCV